MGMGLSNTFPVQLFLFFEGAALSYWTSGVVKPNHAVTLWPAQALGALGWILHLESQLAPSFLVEATAVDTAGYVGEGFELGAFWRDRPSIYFTIHYFYHIRFKITFCTLPGATIPSMGSPFPNAGWLEREATEMMGLPIGPKVDGRNLLLDYATSTPPMRRAYPCVGEVDVLYSPLDEEVTTYPLSSSEL
jgi:NADH:ubiquinone oxidoreductase subunit C